MTRVAQTDLQTAPGLPTLTDAAAARVRTLQQECSNAALKLRVYVQGGGCSGFQYGFSMEEAVHDDDTLVECAGATLVVDAQSAPFLAGARVDCQEDLYGAQFVIDNPNAQSTCGCGSSFEP
ncbi:MAG TPA: iron-sulfur cluster insertion protein ErpA [Castellaniella sp.]|uniref:iron-sulfur cluster insertion protein ErpA n=1 Tax=Castellaniella sp. TaxID=1955812 RepID=UPI002EFD9EE8